MGANKIGDGVSLLFDQWIATVYSLTYASRRNLTEDGLDDFEISRRTVIFIEM
jgi:hypothetical protein